LEAAEGADSRVIDALRAGNKLEAIRIYRELTNSGLSEAMAAVDGLMRRIGMA